jgi:hypothetical protein
MKMGNGDRGKRGEMVKGEAVPILCRDSFFFLFYYYFMKREPFDVRFHHPLSSHSSYITYRGEIGP